MMVCVAKCMAEDIVECMRWCSFGLLLYVQSHLVNFV